MKILATMALIGSLVFNSCSSVNYNLRPNIGVVVVDMQDSFLENLNKKEKEKEIPNQIKILDYCKNNSIPVFVLELRGSGPTTDILKDRIDGLEKKFYISKDEEDGFHDTDLAEKLDSTGVKSILLMGVNASACVKSTAESALDHGYYILTSKELIADPWFFGKLGESINWYKKNCFYKKEYKDLLKVISKN